MTDEQRARQEEITEMMNQFNVALERPVRRQGARARVLNSYSAGDLEHLIRRVGMRKHDVVEVIAGWGVGTSHWKGGFLIKLGPIHGDRNYAKIFGECPNGGWDNGGYGDMVVAKHPSELDLPVTVSEDMREINEWLRN